MGNIVFECETVTPLFMYGADDKMLELRPASIKGVMRFWWRAINGNLPLDKLREQEAEIFGDTKRKSSFSIKIYRNNLDRDKFNPLPHKPKSFKIDGFSPNQTFEIEFFGKNIEKIKNIFLLSTILGGFGQRARRGFGSIQIVGNEVLTSSNQIEEFIKENINSDFSIKYQDMRDREKYPYIRKIEIGKLHSSYQELVKKISQATSGKCGKYLFKDDRLASPIYVSILKFSDNDFRPIITTLNSVSEKKIDFKMMLKRQDDFKKAIL